MIKILILHVEAGYGHKKAAEAIAEEMAFRNEANIQVEILDALDKTNRFFKYVYPRSYHRMVLWVPWLWGFLYSLTNQVFIYRILAPLRSIWNRLQARKLRDYLKQRQFDYILFAHFFPAEVAGRAKKEGLIHSELITVITDVIPHQVWMNPGMDYYWVMAEESKKPLIKKGVPERLIFAQGIPISSSFTQKLGRAVLEEKFGLWRDRTTLLFTSGSFGTGPTEKILDLLQEFGSKLQVIVVCGKNKSLFETLAKRRFSFPTFLFGFVDNMPELMSASDLLLAKPGGLTMCESLAKGVPMIMLQPIPGQETQNAEWLAGRKAALPAKNEKEIKELVSRFLKEPQFFESTRTAILQIAKPYAARNLVDFILKRSK